MTLHSLRIHLDPGPATRAIFERHFPTMVPVQSYILLASDLKAFCVSMHITEEDHKGAAIVVGAYPGAKPRLRALGARPESDRMKCQLRDTRYRPMDRDLQDCLLAPLASIIRMGQRVSFTGPICNTQQVAHLKKVMGPTLLCQSALSWSQYKECELAKEVADATVGLDELEFVVNLYRLVVTKLAIMMQGIDGNERAVFMSVPPFGEMVKVIDTFTVEVMVTLACGELKLRQVDNFLKTSRHVHQILREWDSDDSDRARVLTAGVLDRFLSAVIYTALYRPIPSAKRITIARCIGMTFPEKMGDRPHLSHNLKVLERQSDHSVTLKPEHLPLDQCAAVCLPCTTTSYYKAFEDPSRTGVYNGWHDVGFLRSLSKQDKEEIRAMQEHNNIGQTDFTQL